MFVKRRLAAFAPVIAALSVAAPAAFASAATSPSTDPVITGPSCPAGYAGPTNLATGCPYWMMTYQVAYPGQQSFHCSVNWNVPPAGPGARVADVCAGAPTAK
jgi:hypothetical protein